jgi:TatD DNase family protein
MFIDTHTHLYLPEFDTDRDQSIARAADAGVSLMLLPNIDHTSWKPMEDACARFPENCFPMAGLHPTSVTPESVADELAEVEKRLKNGTYVAVGEIGIDLYWDTTHLGLQEDAFRFQLQLAKKHALPVAIHVRKSFDEVWKILKKEAGPELKGVFHCFPGDVNQARLVTEAGFLLGIGGVVTYKKSAMQTVVAEMGPEHLLLETDAPFLTPTPYRGQRNESAYIPVIAAKVAELTGLTTDDIARITTRNALRLFRLPASPTAPSA